ncbi:MAG: ABC-2 family transporter protein [Defluviitaleaceae bacterium]|nr:ABC-2 family transporter protein [Defluviitaleaceae bacterium]
MKQKILLFKYFFKMNFKALEIYDKDFIIGVITMVIKYVVSITALIFIFDFIQDINGWDLDGLLLIYGLNLIGFSLWSSLFINTISLPYYIRDGEFDRFLLRPIHPLFQIMMDGFDEDSWGELIVGIIILIIAWTRLDITWSYLIFVPFIAVAGCLIYAGISILLSTVSFFTITQSDVANLTFEIKELARYPFTIYPKTISIFFTFIVPIALVSFTPASIILGMYSPLVFLLFPIIGYLFYRFSKFVWGFGVRYYGSTGT